MSQNEFTAYVFTDGPEDWWFGWQKLSDLEKSIANSQTPLCTRMAEEGFDLHERLCQLLYATQEAAMGLGWEGDVRGAEAYGAVLPSISSIAPKLVVAWKQDNNGQCFFGTDDPYFGLTISESQYGHSGEPDAVVTVVTKTNISFAEK